MGEDARVACMRTLHLAPRVVVHLEAFAEERDLLTRGDLRGGEGTRSGEDGLTRQLRLREIA